MKTLLMCVALAAACGGKATPAAGPAVSSHAGAQLTITELKFYAGSELGMKLAANGTISIKNKSWTKDSGSKEEWKDVGQLTSDGKVLIDGKVKLELQDDGTFKSVGTPDQMGFKLDGTTLVTGEKGDQRITIGDNGVFQGTNAGFDMRVDGANDDGSKRTALLLLGIISSPGSADSSPEAKQD